MLEDVLSEHAADTTGERSKQTASVDGLTSETAAASNKSLSNVTIISTSN